MCHWITQSSLETIKWPIYWTHIKLNKCHNGACSSCAYLVMLPAANSELTMLKYNITDGRNHVNGWSYERHTSASYSDSKALHITWKINAFRPRWLPKISVKSSYPTPNHHPERPICKLSGSVCVASTVLLIIIIMTLSLPSTSLS